MTMKTKNLIIIGILFFASVSLYGQNFFMYVDGEKRFYNVSPNKLLVQHFDRSLDSVEIRNSLQRISVEPRRVARVYSEFMLIEMENEPKERIVTLVEQWNDFKKDAYVSPVIYGEDGFKMSFIQNQILVGLKHENDYGLLLRKLQSYNVKAVEMSEFDSKLYIVTLSDAKRKNSMQVANELFETGLFEYAEPNIFHFVRRNTNDPLFQYQWGLHSNLAGIRAPQAWTITTGSPNIRIAILDSGVDLGHPDLASNLLPGFNASTGASNGNVDWDDPNYPHGTAVAGIAAAIRNNGEGIAGVAPNSRIIPIYDGMRTNSLVAAINWARQNGADVISISSSYGETNALNTAFHNAATAGRNGLGCVIVAASGNSNSAVSYPARRHDVISVGAIVSTGVRWPNSNFGTDLDVVAPGGAGIVTTDIRDNIMPGRIGYAVGNYFFNFGGTSAAAPHVAGVAALVLSVNPNLKSKDVRNIIERTAQKVGEYTYQTIAGRLNGTWNNRMGHGLVDAASAVVMVNDNQLRHWSVIGGTVHNSSNPYFVSLSSASGFSGGVYLVRRHEVRRTVTFPEQFLHIAGIWGKSGWPLIPENAIYFGHGFSEVISSSSNSATFRTNLCI